MGCMQLSESMTHIWCNINPQGKLTLWVRCSISDVSDIPADAVLYRAPSQYGKKTPNISRYMDSLYNDTSWDCLIAIMETIYGLNSWDGSLVTWYDFTLTFSALVVRLGPRGTCLYLKEFSLVVHNSWWCSYCVRGLHCIFVTRHLSFNFFRWLSHMMSNMCSTRENYISRILVYEM